MQHLLVILLDLCQGFFYTLPTSSAEFPFICPSPHISYQRKPYYLLIVRLSSCSYPIRLCSRRVIALLGAAWGCAVFIPLNGLLRTIIPCWLMPLCGIVPLGAITPTTALNHHHDKKQHQAYPGSVHRFILSSRCRGEETSAAAEGRL